MKYYIGLVMVFWGVAWLVVDYFWGLTRLNMFLILPLLLILVGTLLYVLIQKNDSQY